MAYPSLHCCQRRRGQRGPEVVDQTKAVKGLTWFIRCLWVTTYHARVVLVVFIGLSPVASFRFFISGYLVLEIPLMTICISVCPHLVNKYWDNSCIYFVQVFKSFSPLVHT